MNRMLKMALGFVLLASLLLPCGSAFAQVGADPPTNTLVANAQQLQVIREIWGQPMSVAQYYEAVYPGELTNILKALPADARHYVFEMQWQWPTIPSVPATSAATDTQSSQIIQGEMADNIVDVAMHTTAPFSPYTNTVAHGALVITSPPTTMLSLSFTSYLYYWTGTGQELVGSYSRWQPFASTLDGTNYVFSTDEGLYLNATSCSFISPLGYSPPWGGFPGNSGWWWVDP